MAKHSAVRNRVEYALARAVVASLEYPPRRIAMALGRFYLRLADRLVPRLRRIARRNLELAFPESSPEWRERTIDGVFRSIARLLVVTARFPRIGRGEIAAWVELEGLEHVLEARNRGRGVLFESAHLGNWELSAYAFSLLVEPMRVLVRPLDNPFLDGLVRRRRELGGNRVIDKRDSARVILRALAAGEAVGILNDQNSGLEDGIFVDFFGVKACTNPAFARIAARSGAAVVPGFALWHEDRRRYVLRFYPPVEITGDAEADTGRLQTAIERVVREFPDQWLWIHRRWKTRPPGEPPVYD